MSALLTLTHPASPLVNIDVEHRYDFFFPHVFQIPGEVGGLWGTADGSKIFHAGGREFMSNGETVVTCSLDGSFGVQTFGWSQPPEMLIWGKPLVGLVSEQLRKNYGDVRETNSRPIGRERVLTEFVLKNKKSVAEGFKQKHANSRNWTIETPQEIVKI
jgi:hypothetical protein